MNIRAGLSKLGTVARGIKLLGAFAFLLLVSAQGYGEDCRHVTFSAHPNYPPYHWAENGRIVGASADITEMILEELGLDYEAKFVGPWKRVLLNAEKGKIDLILGLKNVPERRTYLTFTESPFYENPVGVFVIKGKEFTFNSWPDLSGKRGTLNLGDRFGEDFDRFVEEKLQTVRVTGLEANFNALYRKRSDYFITGLYTGRAFLEKYRYGEEVTYLEKPVATGHIYHGFSSKSSCLSIVDYFNKRLKALKEDGTTEAFMEKNLKKWKNSDLWRAHK